MLYKHLYFFITTGPNETGLYWLIEKLNFIPVWLLTLQCHISFVIDTQLPIVFFFFAKHYFMTNVLFFYSMAKTVLLYDDSWCIEIWITDSRLCNLSSWPASHSNMAPRRFEFSLVRIIILPQSVDIYLVSNSLFYSLVFVFLVLLGLPNTEEKRRSK